MRQRYRGGAFTEAIEESLKENIDSDMIRKSKHRAGYYQKIPRPNTQSVKQEHKKMLILWDILSAKTLLSM